MLTNHNYSKKGTPVYVMGANLSVRSIDGAQLKNFKHIGTPIVAHTEKTCLKKIQALKDEQIKQRLIDHNAKVQAKHQWKVWCQKHPDKARVPFADIPGIKIS